MDTPFLTPIEKPAGLLWKLVYAYSRKKFGKVMTPIKVLSARLPLAFAQFSGKVSQLDEKLLLPPETVMLVRQKVAEINVCHFCIDIGRSRTIQASMNQAKFDDLHRYEESAQFSAKEKVLLDFVSLLARNRQMNRDMFGRLAAHYSEREICEITWIVATEFYYNIGNVALNIHSDMLCDIARRRKG